MLSNKKIKKLKIFYSWKYDPDGLFISFKLIWLNFKPKPKPVSAKPTVKLLKTNWYVIPIPTENLLQLENWWKPLFNLKLDISIISVYKYYDSFFKQESHIFFNSFYSIYNPDILSNVNKFDSNFWFDILWTLHNVNWLLADSSFSKYWIKHYYSKNKFKFYSLVVFQKMFKIYINPNLPLRRWKTENFIPWQEGQAWLKIWEFIFKQLVFESSGLNYNFSKVELKFFLQAQVNPNDNLYIWAFRRLHLLGLSWYDGKLLSSNSSQIFHLDEKLFFELVIKNLILKQFNYWKEIFFNLAKNNQLFYDPTQIENVSFNLELGNNWMSLTSIKHKNFFLYKYLKSKFLTTKNLLFTSTPIPAYFFGTKKTFFNKNFLLFSTKDLRFSPFKLQKEKFKLSSNFKTLKTINFEVIKQSIIKFKYMDFWKYKILINSITTDSKEYGYITPKQTLLLLNDNCTHSNIDTILPIPEFLREFFFLLMQPNITFDDIDDICIKPFLIIIWSLYFNQSFLTYKFPRQLHFWYKISCMSFLYNIIWNDWSFEIKLKKQFWHIALYNPIKMLIIYPIVKNYQNNGNISKFNLQFFFKKNLKISSITFNFFKLLKIRYYLIFLILSCWNYFLINFLIILKSYNYVFKKLTKWINLFFFKFKKQIFNHKMTYEKIILGQIQSNILTIPNFSKHFWTKSAKFIMWTTLTKFWEKQKIYFIVNTMFKSFWYTNTFKYKFNISNTLFFFKYYNTQKFFNFFFLTTKISVKPILLYDIFFFDFLKIFYKIKYFFIIFKSIVKLQLK